MTRFSPREQDTLPEYTYIGERFSRPRTLGSAIGNLPVPAGLCFLGLAALFTVPLLFPSDPSRPFSAAHDVQIGEYRGTDTIEKVRLGADLSSTLDELIELFRKLPTYYLDSYNDLGIHLHYLHAGLGERSLSEMPPGPAKDLWLLSRALRLRSRVPPTYQAALSSRDLPIHEAGRPEVRAILQLYARTEAAQIDFGQAPPNSGAIPGLRVAPLELPEIVELDPSNLVAWTALALDLDSYSEELGLPSLPAESDERSSSLRRRLHLHCALLAAHLAVLQQSSGAQLIAPGPCILRERGALLKGESYAAFLSTTAASPEEKSALKGSIQSLVASWTGPLNAGSDGPSRVLPPEAFTLDAQLSLMLLNNVIDAASQVQAMEHVEILDRPLLDQIHSRLDRLCDQAFKGGSQGEGMSIPPLHVLRLTLLEAGVTLRECYEAHDSLEWRQSLETDLGHLRKLVRQNARSRSANHGYRYGPSSCLLIYRLLTNGKSPIARLAAPAQVKRFSKEARSEQ